MVKTYETLNNFTLDMLKNSEDPKNQYIYAMIMELKTQNEILKRELAQLKERGDSNAVGGSIT